jgi:proton glutamate symport protein
VPTSFFDAAARNDALQITFFAILFAVALSQVRGPAKMQVMSLVSDRFWVRSHETQ